MSHSSRPKDLEILRAKLAFWGENEGKQRFRQSEGNSEKLHFVIGSGNRQMALAWNMALYRTT